MAMNFAALVVHHRFTHGRRLRVEHSRKAVDNRHGAGVIHLGQHDKVGGAFHQCAHRETVAGTVNQIALPKVGNDPALHLKWANVNAQYVLDQAVPVSTVTAKLADLTVMGRADSHLEREFAPKDAGTARH